MKRIKAQWFKLFMFAPGVGFVFALCVGNVFNQ